MQQDTIKRRTWFNCKSGYILGTWTTAFLGRKQTDVPLDRWDCVLEWSCRPSQHMQYNYKRQLTSIIILFRVLYYTEWKNLHIFFIDCSLFFIFVLNMVIMRYYTWLSWGVKHGYHAFNPLINVIAGFTYKYIIYMKFMFIYTSVLSPYKSALTNGMFPFKRFFPLFPANQFWFFKG